MRLRPLISLVLIVLIPLLVAGWLGWKVARDERLVVRQRLSAEVADQLELVDRSYVAPYFDGKGSILREMLAALPFNREILRNEARRSSHISHLFIIDGETGDLLYPWPLGSTEDLNEAEQAFLDRTTDLWEIGVTPVLRVASNRSSTSRILPFLEAGLGAHLLSNVRFSDLNLSTSLQFGSHIGAGIYFGKDRRFSLIYRFQHLSNASVKQPNPGVEFHLLQFGFRLPTT